MSGMLSGQRSSNDTSGSLLKETRCQAEARHSSRAHIVCVGQLTSKHGDDT